MVPCQPRQLVIFSLPFAALVAFFLFRRRRNSSRSDPGGTLAPPKEVDKSHTELQACDSEEVKLPAEKSEAAVVKAVTETVLAVEKSDNFVTPKKQEFVCNGAAAHIKEDPEVEKTSSKEAKDLTTPEVETNTIFHSTIIEDENNQHNLSTEDHKPVEETIDKKEVRIIESVNKINSDSVKADKKTLKEIEEVNSLKTELEEKLEEKEDIITVETVIEEEVPSYAEEEKSIPIEDQSTLENPCVKKTTTEDSCAESSDLHRESFDDSLADSDHSLKDLSDLREDTSTDTGVGSQDESQASMAQGQKTEEKAERDGAGLEQKLASLGLDTQQPARDSANHSPVEMMLSSPAISTFSDAHSEGSSDSGKGCSDVVTPPSRTPAGGSSVAGDHAPSSYEFVLPQVIVGRLIGRHGAFLHDIRAKTHTNVFIKRHPETNTLKICAIEGAQTDIDAALKMIRQKFPLRRFPDLTLERVSFVKNSSLPISPENLQLHLVEGLNNDVIVSSLISAGHMFLQLPMHLSYQSLYRLACIMNNVYSTQDSPPLPDPQPDVVCVAPAHGGWYRAQILSVDEDNNTSDIRFLDYGGFVTIDNSMLRQIRGDFLLLPFQAVECALANVVPAGGEEEWSEEAKQFVQLMTTQQTLQAQVYEYTETGIPLVYLYCTQFYQSTTDPTGFETKVVLLNEELVSRGYADLIDPMPEDGQAPLPTEST